MVIGAGTVCKKTAPGIAWSKSQTDWLEWSNDPTGRRTHLIARTNHCITTQHAEIW
jgi:hypothetical protein